MIELTQEEFNNLFTKYPQVRKTEAGTPVCPYCANPFSPRNLEYYEQSTEAGTPYCSFEISCDICDREVWRGASWGCIDTKEELIEDVGDDLQAAIDHQIWSDALHHKEDDGASNPA